MLGVVDEGELPRSLQRFDALLKWQQKLASDALKSSSYAQPGISKQQKNPGSVASTNGAPRGAPATNGSNELMAEEFGADLEYSSLDENRRRFSLEAHASTSSAAASSMTAGHGFEPSPQDFQNMFRRHQETDDAAVGAAGAGMFSLYSEADDAQDSDEEEDRKRPTKVGLSWLQRWCSKIAGGRGCSAGSG